MTRHPAASRVHKPAPSSDDRFVAGVLETSAWAKEHSRAVIAGAIIVAVLIAGLVLYRINSQRQYEAATAQLGQARQAFLTGNMPLAVRDLEAFLVTYGRTRPADEARLMLGQAYLETGQPQQAIETVSRMARDPRTTTGTNAALLTAAAHEAAGDVDQAEQVFLRVGDRARFEFQRLEALDNAARIRIERGMPAGAVEIYDRILAELEEAAPERAVFELRRGEAAAAAMAAAG
jgi:predicted negative regulator of RcsB-dependent stress response